MTFVNQQKREILTRFLKRHYPLPRRKELDFEINNVVTDYLAKRDTGKPFEARGLYVTGESRTGKTKEINTAIESFNTSGTRLPDGLTARFVQCTLSGMLSWKDLGIEVLDSLGFPMAAQRNQSYIWNEVVKQARLQGVWQLIPPWAALARVNSAKAAGAGSKAWMRASGKATA